MLDAITPTGPAAHAAARPTRGPTAPAALPLPRRWGIRSSDVGAVGVGLGVLVVLMWVRHGGLELLSSPAGVLTAAGQLTALLGTYVALVQLVLMARSPFLDQVVGPDRLAWLHRWLGFACMWLIAGHVGLTTVGYAASEGRAIVDQAIAFLLTYPFVLAAAAGLGLMLLVTVTSIRAARRRMGYETWFGLHLYAYLAVALAFAHQLAVGSDFVDDPVAVAFWVSLYVATAALVLVFRVGQPIALAAAPSLRGRQRGDRGPRRRQHLRDGPGHRSPRGPCRPVLQPAPPHRPTAGGEPTRSPCRRRRTAASCGSP